MPSARALARTQTMSIIASFYLVKLEDIETLKDLALKPAEPITRKFLWHTVTTNRWRSPFWEFLHSQYHELEQLGWSGSVMLAVESFLLADSIDILNFADKELSEFFQKARESYFAIFRKQGAQQLAEILAKYDRTKLEDPLQTNTDIPEEIPSGVIYEGRIKLRNWLLQVDEAHLGLYYIG